MKETKSQGKGKGEKWNKNPHVDVVCRFCKKKSRIEKNRWAKKGVNNADEVTGGGASSSGVHHVESVPQGWFVQTSREPVGYKMRLTLSSTEAQTSTAAQRILASTLQPNLQMLNSKMCKRSQNRRANCPLGHQQWQ